MSVLQCGAPKSGNFWLCKIIQQALSYAGKSTTSFIERQPIYPVAQEWKLNFDEQARMDMLDVTDLQYSYRISSVFQMPIDNIAEYALQAPHVWTHSPVCKRSEELFNTFEKKVYIVRDPRDRAISAAKYYCSAYMQKYFPQEEKDPRQFLTKNFDTMMKYWVWHVFDHLRLSKQYAIHVCYFEGFITDFQKELQLLLNYLELDLSKTRRTELEKAVSFEKMKKKNPDHLKKGEAGYWMYQLTNELVERSGILAGPLIRHLGYPAESMEAIGFSRKSAKGDFQQLKKEIIHSQRRLAATDQTLEPY